MANQESHPKTKKLSEESAEKVLSVLYDYYENNLSERRDEKMDLGEEGGSTFGDVHRGLLKAVRGGRLKVTEDGEDGLAVTQVMRDSQQKIEYKVLDGHARLVMQKKTGLHSKIFLMLGHMSGKGPDVFPSFKGVDLTLAECLGLFFLSC